MENPGHFSVEINTYGDRGYADRNARVEAILSGEVLKGDFAMGLGIDRVLASRSSEGFVFNSAGTRIPTTASYSAYTCPTGADDCLPGQFFSTRIVQDAYEVSLGTWHADLFLETEQKFGDFTLRGGLRADYNDVLDNFDVAPRLTLAWDASDALTFVAGANRYYNGDYLTYAINDAVPRGTNQRRTANSAGVVGDWTTASVLSNYSYTTGDLDTPYADEVTLAALWSDPWSGGDWRIKYLRRDGKDQFAEAAGGNTVTENTLTNDGTSLYESFGFEYTKNWEMPATSRMDRVGLYVSGIWADRDVSNNSVFANADGEYFWYNGGSYSSQRFEAVTGNLDIPIRSTIELRGSWDQGKYELGLAADVAFGYTGAYDTGTTTTATNADGFTGDHYVYEDKRFDTSVTFDLSAKARLAEFSGNPLDLHVKVSNLLGDIGNRTATYTNPWVSERSVWIGTTYTW